jgi:hypothetical protein
MHLEELTRAAGGWRGGEELAEDIQEHKAHLERWVRCELGGPRADFAALRGRAQPAHTGERDASGGPFVRLPTVGSCDTHRYRQHVRVQGGRVEPPHDHVNLIQQSAHDRPPALRKTLESDQGSQDVASHFAAKRAGRSTAG